MNDKHPWDAIGFAIVAGLMSVPAFAFEKLDANTFIDACETFQRQTKEGGHSSICKAYLQGYFAGRYDVVVVEDLPSPFMLRAVRTRAPGRTPSIKALKETRYCLSKEASFQDFAVKATGMKKRFAEGVDADRVIEQVLERYYLCES